MGGHGALVAALRNPDRYRSVSAFAPIAAPSQCPWGQKAFSGYLGPDRLAWRHYDATELIGSSGWRTEILVDQGTGDPFLDEQLKPQLLAAAFGSVPLRPPIQEGSAHSYDFIANFIAAHVAPNSKQAIGTA